MAKSKSARGPGRPPKYAKSDGADRSVKRFQVSLRPDVFEALEAFRKDKKFATERSSIIEMLIEQFLVQEGRYSPPQE